MVPGPSLPQSSEEGRVKTFSHPCPGAQVSSLLYFHAGPSCPWPSLSQRTPGTVASTVVSALSISVAKAAFQAKNFTQTQNGKSDPSRIAFIQRDMGTRSLSSEVTLDSFGKGWGVL